jgi:hypothetical protein
MLARAAAAAALALLISGDIARLGWDAVSVGRFLFPYLGLFLFIEIARVRRRLEDGEAFLVGAAVSLLYAGIYTKSLQGGFHPLGIDWMAAVTAGFDGGMTTVLALHVLAVLRPRANVEMSNALVMACLAVILAGGACVYAIKSSLNFYQGETMMDSTLFGDVFFAAIALTLIVLAKNLPSGRDPWIFGLAAVAVWLPGARFIGHLCASAGVHELLLYTIVGIWTAAIAGLLRKLWFESRGEDAPARDSREAMGVAIWRTCGAITIALIIGSAQTDGRADGVFSVGVDLPSRAMFAVIFIKYRLKV